MEKNKKKFFDVIVIGGGAAGMMAAIHAAGNGASTAIIEHKDRVGKKILSTGNGKCNYTNAVQGIQCYRSDDPAFVLPVFEQFDFTKTVAFFEELGIWPKVKNGYYYPASEQASAVLDVLRHETEYRHVSVFTEQAVMSVEQKKNRFLIQTKECVFEAKTVLFATGLLAAPKTGSDGSALPLIKQFGHRLSDVVPALVALHCGESFFKQLAGIRTEARVELFVDGVSVSDDLGEVQLTDYGISGIPVFQVSRFATKALKRKQEVSAVLDFMPNCEERPFSKMLCDRFSIYAHDKTAAEALTGLFHKKLAEVLLKESHISSQAKAASVSNKQLSSLAYLCKHFKVQVCGSKPFDQAQVCAGGIQTEEIDPHTMESRLVPGLFFAGEVVDVDGICGGYNLQWAWSSGMVAGTHAALLALNGKR